MRVGQFLRYMDGFGGRNSNNTLPQVKLAFKRPSKTDPIPTHGKQHGVLVAYVKRTKVSISYCQHEVAYLLKS